MKGFEPLYNEVKVHCLNQLGDIPTKIKINVLCVRC
jgi:hypothetical protein